MMSVVRRPRPDPSDPTGVDAPAGRTIPGLPDMDGLEPGMLRPVRKEVCLHDGTRA